MDSLKIEPKHDSPLVLFDPENDYFSMSGTMHPENIQKFMDPILDWMAKFGNSKDPGSMNITTEFFFRYLNSSSYKYLINVLEKLVDYQNKGAKVNVIWKYEADDEDMRDRGEDLFEFTDMPLQYEFIAVE